MAKDDDSVIIGFLGGLLGYQIGKNENSFFEPFTNRFRHNYQLLRGFNIVPPLTFLARNKNLYLIYRESIVTFLFGLPNSSLTGIVRILEQCLKQKFQQINEKPSDKTLESLIDWFESSLKEDHLIAQYLRKLRNFIHEDILVSEQDVIEAIRHVSKIVTKFYPNVGAEWNIQCFKCGLEFRYVLTLPDGILSDSIQLQCPNCKHSHTFPIPLLKK